MRKVKFYTLGCKVNQYDTQNIRERFAEAGFVEVHKSEKADLCLINTCTVTHQADLDSLNLARKAKRDNPRAKIVVTGCLAELDQKRIKREAQPDLIVRHKDKNKIINIFTARFPEASGPAVISKQKESISTFSGRTRAFLKIQDGCDNFCAYCKVPLVRGRSKSKSLKNIISEAKDLAAGGFKEIVLTGICLGAYGRDLKPGLTLVKVIDQLEGIAGLARIRLSSIEARDVSAELIEKISRSPKLCPHLHIPIQSGDNHILKKMNRLYSREDYLKLILKIKEKIPQIAITTDAIVGFPGEQEENFKNTLRLIKQIIPLKVHIFPYSFRPGTLTDGNLPVVLDHHLIKDRVARLKKLAETCAWNYQKQFLGKPKEVLFEAKSKADSAYWEGHTDNYLKVRFASSENLTNRLMPLSLKSIDKNIFTGE